MKYLTPAILALAVFALLWGGLALIYQLDTPRPVYWVEPSNLTRV